MSDQNEAAVNDARGALERAIEANRANFDTWIDSDGNVRTYEGPYEKANVVNPDGGE